MVVFSFRIEAAMLIEWCKWLVAEGWREAGWGRLRGAATSEGRSSLAVFCQLGGVASLADPACLSALRDAMLCPGYRMGGPTLRFRGFSL